MKNRCPKCGAAVRWERTGDGHAVPLDPVPVKPTPSTLCCALVEGVVVWNGEMPAGTPRYVSHFMTCPGTQRRPKGG